MDNIVEPFTELRNPGFEAELEARLSAMWRNRKREIHNNLIQ